MNKVNESSSESSESFVNKVELSISEGSKNRPSEAVLCIQAWSLLALVSAPRVHSEGLDMDGG